MPFPVAEVCYKEKVKTDRGRERERVPWKRRALKEAGPLRSLFRKTDGGREHDAGPAVCPNASGAWKRGGKGSHFHLELASVVAAVFFAAPSGDDGWRCCGAVAARGKGDAELTSAQRSIRVWSWPEVRQETGRMSYEEVIDGIGGHLPA